MCDSSSILPSPSLSSGLWARLQPRSFQNWHRSRVWRLVLSFCLSHWSNEPASIAWFQKPKCVQPIFLPFAVMSFKLGIKEEQAGLRLLDWIFQRRGHEVEWKKCYQISKQGGGLPIQKKFPNHTDADPLACGSQATQALTALALHCGTLGCAAKTRWGNSQRFNLTTFSFELFAGHHFDMSRHRRLPACQWD